MESWTDSRVWLELCSPSIEILTLTQPGHRFAKNVVGLGVARSRTPDGCFQHLVGYSTYHGVKGYIRD